MSHVIVPLDGSDLARRAIPTAVVLAKATGAKLQLVEAAVSPASLDVGQALEMLVEAATANLKEEAAAIEQNYGLSVHRESALAFPDRLILEHAAHPDSLAIVMSTHGRTGLLRLARGSVAEAVLRQSPIPVYLVPAASEPAGTEYPSLRRILVPLDGSDLAYSVMAPVTELAQAARAEITLFRVFVVNGLSEHAAIDAIGRDHDLWAERARAYFAPIEAKLRESGVPVTARWSIGHAAEHILAAAGEAHADLIALATHGRSGLDRLRYGSVAEEVLRHSKRTLMTFGPQAMRRLHGAVSTAGDRKPSASIAS